MIVDLTALWHTNRRWRAWMDANTKFVTPDTLDALRYMDGECREVRDLWMRQQKPEHVRNNGRDSTIEQELADVAMMALTALPEPPPMGGFGVFDADYMCDNANNAVLAFRMNVPSWDRRVYWTLNHVLAYPGLDLPAELDRCHRRLAIKHGMGALAKWLHSQGETEASIGYIYYKENTGNWWHAPWLVEES